MTTNKKHICIIGGTGGIGKALLNRLYHDESVARIFATYHNRVPANFNTSDIERRADSKVIWLAMDVTCERSIKNAIIKINEHAAHIDWVINAVGLLHNDTHHPEKAVRQLDPDFFIENMTINALPSLLIAKHIKPLLKASNPSDAAPAIYATISARVGSISDNRLGGWYSYRMSKAALNMGMKTLSIEWQRSLKNVCVVVMQPGTVDTSLSKPYQTNVPKETLFEPNQCSDNLLSVLGQLTFKDTGCFVDWAGKPINW